jgi:hypothetical protein
VGQRAVMADDPAPGDSVSPQREVQLAKVNSTYFAIAVNDVVTILLYIISNNGFTMKSTHMSAKIVLVDYIISSGATSMPRSD